MPLETKDGRSIDVEFVSNVYQVDGKKIIQCNVRGITERKRSEKALQESEERYATTLASIGDAIITADIEGNITFMNAVAEDLTGWTFHEASMKLAKDVYNIINEHTRLKVENPVTKVLENGAVICLANHTVLIRRDGTEVAIDDSGAPIKDRKGNTLGVVLVFRDITERKLADEALKESEEKYRNLVERANDGITIIQDGTVRYANPALAEIWGGSVEEIVGRPFTDFIDPDEIPKVVERYQQRMANEFVTPMI